MLARISLAIFLCIPFAYAAEITGTVTNKTTNKPAAGDDVILLKLQEGMQEVARAKTDASGKFRLTFPDDNAPHLVRVNHRNVNYHRPAPPGTTSVEVEVFDAAEDVPRIKQTVDVMRMEADATSLRVIRMFAVENTSNPPRTQLRQRNFEIQLPEEAQIEQAMAAGPGGMPVMSAPVPTGEKGRYAFLFPLRPGETRFQVAYTLPYSGKATLEPKILQPTESFAVSVPQSMSVAPAAGSRLERKGEEAGMAVYVAQNATPGQPLGFTVSGTGVVPTDEQQSTSPQGQTTRGPGGGLGAPPNTPDPLYQYRWWIIGGVAILLVAGAAFSMSRAPAGRAAARSTDALSALKEEMFELEKDKLAGKISATDYEAAKAALDTVLARAMKRGE